MSKGPSPSPENLESPTTGVVESAPAPDVEGGINPQRLFVLDSDQYDAFAHALDNPPAPGPKLRSLMRRVPAWRK